MEDTIEISVERYEQFVEAETKLSSVINLLSMYEGYDIEKVLSIILDIDKIEADSVIEKTDI